ncbi:MAG: tetratricopeptide repeat protein [Vicinamibacteria bacterium]
MTSELWRRRLGNALMVVAAVACVVWGYFVWARVSSPAPPEVELSRVEPLIAEAITAAREAAAAHPRDARAWGELGMVLHAHDMFPSAREAYARAEALDGQDVRWPYLTGSTQPDPAVRADDFRRALAIAPGHVHARMRLADALAELGQAETAAAEYRQALQGELTPWAHVGLARLALARGDAAGAVREAEQALAAHPGLPAAYGVLAAAYFRLGDATRAEASGAIARRDQTAQSWADPLLAEVRARQSGLLGLGRRAADLYRAGRPQEAVAVLEQLVERHPESVRARAGLGRMYVLVGRFTEGETLLREAIAQDDGPLEPHLYLGFALTQQRRCAEAIPIFRALTARQPDYGQAHLRLGLCLYEIGDKAGAADALTEAVRHLSDDALAHKHLGIVLLELGRRAEATTALERAAVLAPDDRGVPMLLARARTR